MVEVSNGVDRRCPSKGTYSNEEPAKEATDSVLEENVLCGKEGRGEKSNLRNCDFASRIEHFVVQGVGDEPSLGSVGL
jgi:hypothetical protein